MTKNENITDASLERWGWASICINVILVGINFLVAYASDSLAVAAEMVHNAVDLVAAIAVLLGLKLSKRRSRNFPYGLYKVENVVAVGIALLVFLTAYEIIKEATLTDSKETIVSTWILVGVVASIVIPLVFGFFELRVGRNANSPSLIADAQEYRVHVLTSGVVLISILLNSMGLPLDGIAAIFIAIVITKTGWSLLSDAMRVLLDASLDPETLASARQIVENEPQVVSVSSIIGRNAGRYLFLEVDVEIRARDMKQKDIAVQRLETAILENIPHVERVRVNTKPSTSETVIEALPLEAPSGPLCQRFGTASHFLLVKKNRINGEVVHRTILKNPYSKHSKGRGIKVAQWLIKQKIDVIISPDDIANKGPGHVFGEAGVNVRYCDTSDMELALKNSGKTFLHEDSETED